MQIILWFKGVMNAKDCCLAPYLRSFHVFFWYHETNLLSSDPSQVLWLLCLKYTAALIIETHLLHLGGNHGEQQWPIMFRESLGQLWPTASEQASHALCEWFCYKTCGSCGGNYQTRWEIFIYTINVCAFIDLCLCIIGIFFLRWIFLSIFVFISSY